jgi:hypothetical protein
MGEHVCENTTDRKYSSISWQRRAKLAGLATPPPDSYGNFGAPSPKQNKYGSSFLNPGRAIPPRVDTSAASTFPGSESPPPINMFIDQPFMFQDQLTPVSLSPSRSISPITPSDGSRSPFGRLLRSATAPVLSPSSPEPLSANLDNPSPSFPPAKSASQRRAPQAGGYGGFGLSPPAHDPMQEPASPRSPLLQRADAIVPGPFDVKGGNRTDPTPDKKHLRQRSLRYATMSTRTSAVLENMPRPSTSTGPSQTSTSASAGSKPGLPRVPRNNGYGGFGPPAGGDDLDRDPLRLATRSQTSPLPRADGALLTPLELDSRVRRPSNDSGVKRPNMNERAGGTPLDIPRKPSLVGPDLSRTPPPRGAALTGTRRPSEAPSQVNLAAEFGIGNPYHTPTESQSSDTSASSQVSQASSRSSPPRSAASSRAPWNAAPTSTVGSPPSDIQSSMADLQVRDRAATPPRNKEQPAPAPTRNPEPIRDFTEPPLRNPARSHTPASPGENPTRQRTTKKGNCKGCSEPILGKSVSSADGRLTGRYHKECFVCTTCAEPFQTSTFYVINDAPYCERHYHKLNGSVCTTCDRGIEGPYLESERRQKFHPGCLTCSDCQRNLRNEYFEMGGRVYCERDAFRRAQQGRFLGPGGGLGSNQNRMQRRTTRMMMM